MPNVPVGRMERSLDFYLTLGCEIRQTADGWVLLRTGDVDFTLSRVDNARPGSRPLLHLRTTNLPLSRHRLGRLGLAPGAITYPAHAPGGEMRLTDPDRHLLVISQQCKKSATI